MPKRTNEFQQIIYMMQRQLAGAASVTESKMLEDRETGEQAEVDIVIEASVGGISILVGIECTAPRRPATVEWVREMAKKHEALPINKTILVSKSGFTAHALKKAQACGVEALTLSTAEKIDWKGFVHDLENLTLASYEFKILGGTIDYKKDEHGEVILTPETKIVEENKSPSTLQEYSYAVVNNEKVVVDLISAWLKVPKDKRTMNSEFKVTLTPEKRVRVEDQNGRQVLIQALHVRALCTIKETPISLSAGEYLGKNVVYGKAKNIFSNTTKKDKDVLVTLVSGEKESGELLIPEYGREDKKIFPMKVVSSVFEKKKP